MAAAVLVLVSACSKGPYRFEDLDRAVAALQPDELGEVVSDEESGSEVELATAPARKFEIIIDADRIREAQDFVVAHLEHSGFVRSGPTAEFWNWAEDDRLSLRTIYLEAGKTMPSGKLVPLGMVGLLLPMGY